MISSLAQFGGQLEPSHNGVVWTIVAFALGVLVLDFFDISLPRGDTVGVSGALVSAAIVLLGPLVALPLWLVGTGAAVFWRLGLSRQSNVRAETFAVSAAYMAAAFAWMITSGETFPAQASTLVIAISYLAVELAVAQVVVSYDSSRSALRLIQGNLGRQAPLLAAQVSAAWLTAIIFPAVREWSLLLVVVLLLLIRQSYAMLLDIRETYRTTVEVLVEAAEGTDSRMRGHAERTAQIAREIGALSGLGSHQIERLSYAALLHDIDAIGEAASRSEPRGPSAVLDGVQTFEDVVRILRLYEGSSCDDPSEADMLAAFTVALASDIDARTNPGVSLAHDGAAVARLGDQVPSWVKARTVSAALSLGYRTPAVP